jgi:hypothetical protein
MKIAKYIVMVLIIFSLFGCMGTLTTRVYKHNDVEPDFVGAYPFSGLANDVKHVIKGNGENHVPVPDGFTRMVSFLSIPFDIVVDAILLPADLIAWPFGLKKGWL